MDLRLLATHISSFLKSKGFEVDIRETPGGHQILAANSPYHNLISAVTVSVVGKPEDFTVKVEPSTSKRNQAFRPSLMETMFFGGYFTLQKLKSNEAWIELERELWQRIENNVLKLAGSSKTANSNFE